MHNKLKSKGINVKECYLSEYLDLPSEMKNDENTLFFCNHDPIDYTPQYLFDVVVTEDDLSKLSPKPGVLYHCISNGSLYLYNDGWTTISSGTEHIYGEENPGQKIKYYKLVCDGCGASIELKDENNITCQYCGSKYYKKRYIETIEKENEKEICLES